MTKFHVDIELIKGQRAKVDISGDIDAENWPEKFLAGIDEVIVTIQELYGRELVKKALRRHLDES